MKKQERILKRLKQIQKKDLDNITFFTFSNKIPAPIIRQYSRIVRDYIKLRRKHDHHSCNYNNIYNQFVSHLCTNHSEFYFIKLRPFITVTLQDQFVFDIDSIFGKYMIKNTQPSLFENLIKLILDNQKLDNLQWISFMDMPKITTISIKFNYITILKPVAKCLWSSLQTFEFNWNRFSNHQMSGLYKARFLNQELKNVKAIRIWAYGKDLEQSLFQGMKFAEFCSIVFFYSFFTNYSKKEVRNAMDRKLQRAI